MTTSTRQKIRVGVIGARSIHPGWAAAAHIPALQSLPEFELAAVATSRQETAQAAEAAYGVPAFNDAGLMIATQDLDLVVVAVKAPLHYPLIRQALEAGVAVFSEWPLGVNLTEAQDLARRAQASGVRSFVGLQARFSPILAQARALIGDGFIGRVLATNLSGSGMAWGEETNPAHAYIFDREAGANVLSAPLMHAVDAISFVLGEFKLVASVAAVRRPVVRISGTDASIDVTAPDHAAVAARLCSGAVAAVSYRGATSRAGNLRWEINGAEGDLLITADDGNIQVADLTLSGGRASDALTPLHPDGGAGLAANLHRLYAAIARDLRTGSHEVPDFQHALKRHELLNAIEQGGTA